MKNKITHGVLAATIAVGGFAAHNAYRHQQYVDQQKAKVVAEQKLEAKKEADAKAAAAKLAAQKKAELDAYKKSSCYDPLVAPHVCPVTKTVPYTTTTPKTTTTAKTGQ